MGLRVLEPQPAVPTASGAKKTWLVSKWGGLGRVFFFFFFLIHTDPIDWAPTVYQILSPGDVKGDGKVLAPGKWPCSPGPVCWPHLRIRWPALKTAGGTPNTLLHLVCNGTLGFPQSLMSIQGPAAWRPSVLGAIRGILSVSIGLRKGELPSWGRGMDRWYCHQYSLAQGRHLVWRLEWQAGTQPQPVQ